MTPLHFIHSTIANFVVAHGQFNTFFLNDMDNILQEKDIGYPALFLSPLSITQYKKFSTYTFTAVVLDNTDKADEHTLDILEHTRRLFNDLISFLDRDDDTLTLRLESGGSVQLSNVKDKFNDDNVLGWSANININVINETSSCTDTAIELLGTEFSDIVVLKI